MTHSIVITLTALYLIVSSQLLHASQTAVIIPLDSNSAKTFEETNTEKLSAQVSTVTSAASVPDHIVCFNKEWSKKDSKLSEVFEKLKAAQISEQSEKAVYSTNDSECISTRRLNADQYPLITEVYDRISILTSNTTAKIIDDEDEMISISNAPTEFTAQVTQIQTQSVTPSNSTAPYKNLTQTSDDPSINDFAAKYRTMSFAKKTLKSQGIILGGHAIFLGVLLATPREFTKWEYGLGPELIQHGGETLKKAWTTAPVWDKDNAFTNLFAHPVCGAMTYNMVRSMGANPFVSFLFSTAQSLLWEYTTEALFEQPSIQDILFTSTLGSLMGEGAHWSTMQLRKGGFKNWEKVVVTVINPMYVLNNGYH